MRSASAQSKDTTWAWANAFRPSLSVRNAGWRFEATGPLKGVRVGGTKEPIELYNIDADIGETRNLAARWGMAGSNPSHSHE